LRKIDLLKRGLVTAPATTATTAPATAAATTAFAATATTIAATTAGTSTAAIAAITAPVAHRTRFVHYQSTAQKILTVTGLNRTIGLAIIFDFDESEPA
jgi:hypothetical protein